MEYLMRVHLMVWHEVANTAMYYKYISTRSIILYVIIVKKWFGIKDYVSILEWWVRFFLSVCIFAPLVALIFDALKVLNFLWPGN